MATTYTEHLQIPKHDPADPFDITLINDMADKTEAGILSAYRGRAAYNLLDNSNFRNPVNQRGKTTYTGNGYSIDRWRAYHASTTHTVTASGIAVSATDNNPNIYQVLDPNTIDTEKTYTAAVCDSAGNVTVRAMKPTTTSYSPACIYVSGSNILFRIVGNNTWRWAALYEGEYTAENLPAYVPKGYAAELMECMRYYLAIDANYSFPIGFGETYGVGQGRMLIPTPVQMRVNPTATFPSGKVILTANGSQYAVTNISNVTARANGVHVAATAGNAPSNYACSLFLSENGTFALSADL